MDTVLSRITLSGLERTRPHELYYHSTGGATVEQGTMAVPKGSSVRFDGYFNAFFYPKYLSYTCIPEVSLHLLVAGRTRIRIICHALGKQESVLFEDTTSGGQVDSPAFRLADLPPEGALFLELEALADDVRFYWGWYGTARTPPNAVKVAAVICTYRREDYVLRNLDQLLKTVWEKDDCPIRDRLDVFVVDNGNTLVMEDMPHVQIFPNKNYGGSGGFTRGLMEAYRREYTHVLFMDDDISFETETLVKTVRLLQYARQFERPLCIGGQMLLEDAPAVQFEAGAFYRDGRLVAVNQGMDLSTLNELLRNEMERHVQYNAWWYCCIPISVVDQIGLPLPLFIKTDDVEYGLRMKPHMLLMNGIGVWHVAFSRKYSPHLEYYIKRNELVVSALHDIGAGICPSAWKLIRAAGKAVLIGDPRAVSFMLRAYRDFLEGPDFFLRTDAERLNQELIQEKEQPAKGRFHSILTDPLRLLPVLAAVIGKYRKVQRQYKDRIAELTCPGFWRSHLGLDG